MYKGNGNKLGFQPFPLAIIESEFSSIKEKEWDNAEK